jgi:hypothetical protein
LKSWPLDLMKSRDSKSWSDSPYKERLSLLDVEYWDVAERMMQDSNMRAVLMACGWRERKGT